MSEAALKIGDEGIDRAYGPLSRIEFQRRVRNLRGHMDAVARMVDQGAECAEVLRQMRAVRRASEKLEMYGLMAYINVDPRCLPPESVHAITDLYQKVNR